MLRVPMFYQALLQGYSHIFAVKIGIFLNFLKFTSKSQFNAVE